MHVNVVDLWQQTSLAGKGVIVTLFLMGLLVLTIGVERLVVLLLDNVRGERLLRALRPFFEGTPTQAALNQAKTLLQQGPLSSVQTVLTALFHEGARKKPGERNNEWMERLERLEELERVLERTREREAKRFKRGLAGMATLASSAPFVGLLGTVLGIINVFGTMKLSSSAGISAIAGGIGEALITTALGLVVAIPAGVFFNLLTAAIEKNIATMNDVGSEAVLLLVQATDENH